eukprot:gene3584-4464_t
MIFLNEIPSKINEYPDNGSPNDIDFCKNPSIILCENDTTVTKLSLIGNNTAVVSNHTFSMFSDLISFKLKNSPVPNNFLYSLKEPLKKLHTLDCENCNITTLNPDITFPKIYNLFLRNNIFTGYISFYSLSNVDNIDLTVDSEDFLGDFQIIPGSITPVRNPFSFSISDIKTTPTEVDFPRILFDNCPNLKIFSSENINYKPIQEKIDHSNCPNLNNINFNGSSNFLYQGGYPLTTKNKMTMFIGFDNMKLEVFPDLSQFGNFSAISLKNNKLYGELPLVNFHGSIPESYCFKSTSLTNNLLNGTVPSCFLCYINQTKLLLKGNNFLNYREGDTPKPCDIQIDSVSPLLNTRGLTISGKNFGFQSNPINLYPNSSSPAVTWSYIEDNTILYSSPLTTSNYQLIIKQDYKLNLTFYPSFGPVTLPISIPKAVPLIIELPNSIPYSNLGFLFLIVGLGFNTDPKLIQAKIGPYDCIPITENIKNSFNCVIYTKQQIPEDTYNVIVTVDGVPSLPYPYRYKRENSFFINAITPPYTSGGTVSIFGRFGKEHDNTNVIIGEKDCPITLANDSMIFCTIGPGSGRSELIVTVNGSEIVTDFVYYEEFSKCTNPCINGYCENGACFCKSGFGGSKCDLPTTNSTINNNGNSTEIDLDNVKFGFSIYSIQELFFNKTVNRELVFEKWNLKFSNKTHWVYSYNFETSTISYTIEEVEQDRNISFAGVDMNLTKGSLKLWVTIKEWRYLGSLNNLRLVLVSNATSTNKCSKSTNIQAYESDYSLNYITLEKDGKTLYGRFIDRALSDGRVTFSETRVLKQSEDSIIVGISLPNCKLCELDPNYSMLISGNQDKCSETNNKWVLPTAIVISVFGFISLSIIGVSMVRRYFYISFSRESGLFIMLKSKAASRSSGSDDKSIPLKINK